MLKIGFYEKEITPPLGFQIPGYFNVRLAKGVKTRLYAKAMVISNGKETVAISGADGLLPPRDFRPGLIERLKEYSDIPSDNVLFFVNHTHTGIPLKNKDATEDEISYWHLLTYLVSDCIVLAEQNLQECELFFGRGCVDDVSCAFSALSFDAQETAEAAVISKASINERFLFNLFMDIILSEYPISLSFRDAKEVYTELPRAFRCTRKQPM